MTFGIWRLSYGEALDQMAKRGHSDLTLAADRLIGQLQRYQEVAVLTAGQPLLKLLHTDPEVHRGEAESLLLSVADKTAAKRLIYANTNGQVLAASHPGPAPDLAQKAYFERALHGALGSYHGVDDDTGSRVFVFAKPDFGPDGRVQGVLVVVADVKFVEWHWRGDRPAIYFVDARAKVFITNRSELLFWNENPETGGLFESGRAEDAEPPRESLIRGHQVWAQNWSAYVPDQALRVVLPLPVINMTGVALIEVAPAKRLAWLQSATFGALLLVLGAIILLAAVRRRTMAEANAVLEERVAVRTRDLSDANQRLKQAQADLVRAGKLSALGQMSAGISHELNQPLMAIQQFAENGAQFLQKGRGERAGENLSRISDLAARMARIIKNLRSFARNESEPMGKVDLVQVIDSAAELTEARLKADGVRLDWQPDQANGPVYAVGGEVRLVQVFVNLINNAADAMLDQEDRLIRIVINHGKKLSVTVRDIGPGIDEPDKIFDPFYSTKEVGSSEGMGLGLSISYGLVQSFGGNIRGVNAPQGAMFVVDLEYWRAEKAA